MYLGDNQPPADQALAVAPMRYSRFDRFRQGG
jgi:hypothetical protein